MHGIEKGRSIKLDQQIIILDKIVRLSYQQSNALSKQTIGRLFIFMPFNDI